jgi:hypothetical protein
VVGGVASSGEELMSTDYSISRLPSIASCATRHRRVGCVWQG